MKTGIYSLLLFFMLQFTQSVSAQERVYARDTCNWSHFEASSPGSKDSIQLMDLQGNWVCREINTYGDYLIGTKSTGDEPGYVLEIKGNAWRSTLSGDFQDFRIDQNRVIFRTTTSFDTAHINRITGNELVISFRIAKDYRQYLFKK